MSKRKIKIKVPQLLAFLFLITLTVIWLFPIVWTIFSSFKSEIETIKNGYKFAPIEWVLDNYIIIFKSKTAPMVRWFMNSMFISVTHTIFMVTISALSGYAFARLDFKGRNLIFWVLLGSSMFPGVVNLIPSFRIVHLFGWINTPWAVIVPGLGGVFNIFLIRQFLMGIPRELDEAARIDGANTLQIFIRLILPISRPVLTVVALFSFTGSWNDFLWPSIVINDIEKMPLTPGLKLLQGAFVGKLGQLSAGAVIAIIPPILIYLVAQKYFIKGMNLSAGLKG
jgi:multiple sugar transport system permease protein